MVSGETNTGARANDDLLAGVFVSSGLPWTALRRSFLGHAFVLAAIVGLSQSPFFQSRTAVEPRDPFQHTTITYYSTSDFLPAFEMLHDVDTPPSKPDPIRAKQVVESIAHVPQSRRQTILAPPGIQLASDVPLPNVLPTNPYVPPVPLDSVSRTRLELPASAIAAVQPAPAVTRQDRTVRVQGIAGAVEPTAEVTRQARTTIPVPAAIEPPVSPEAVSRRVGELTIANLAALEPSLPVPDQRAINSLARAASPVGRRGLLPSGADAAVPPPAAIPGGGTRSVLVLNLQPSAVGEVRVPNTTRPGSFAASPDGRENATAQPGVSASRSGTTQIASLRVGPPPDARNAFTAALSQPVVAIPERVVKKTPFEPREVRDELPPAAAKVFGGRKYYSMIVNMPNLASTTGSWVVRYAALDKLARGELSAPVAERKVDPGYPADLRYEGIEGMVTLYAIIGMDGTVRDVRVLEGLHTRLDENARAALARWRFRPGTRGGEAVAVEAVVQISFGAERR